MKKEHQKLNKYPINTQSIRIDLIWSYRLRHHNTWSQAWDTLQASHTTYFGHLNSRANETAEKMWNPSSWHHMRSFYKIQFISALITHFLLYP